jgi:GrpB-like predicted nucleotidyltransferase (UPF0157 family)
MIRPPSEVDENITIVDYDCGWPQLFDLERRRLLGALGDAVTAVEHFGSTAVPGMAAKPIVDLLVGVREFASVELAPLETLGYENFGAIFIAERLYLRRRGPPHFNVAVAVQDSGFWGEQLAVRDFLRAHPDEAAAYSAVKRLNYRHGARLFSSYSQAKEPYLAALRERARRWQSARRTAASP